MVKVGINGFGRIGRQAFKVALDKFPNEVEIVGVNDLTDAKTLAHLLKYDSSYGIYSKNVTSDAQNVIVDGKPYRVYAEKDPTALPWGQLGVDIVIESTGRFTDLEGASKHITAGAKRVIISAPAKGEGVGTYLIGVNADKDTGEGKIINNASCTTNCISPVVAVMQAKFGIAKAMMTTVHSYTQDQLLQDGPHKDLRRARAAGINIVPTTTGAALATTEAIPELKGLFDGASIRVPTPVGSISDITFLLKRKTSVEEVNSVLSEAANGNLKGILAVSTDPLVSTDIVGRTESAIVDLPLTQVVDGDMVKVFAWYDNELGYSNRLIEQVIHASAVNKNTGGQPATTPQPTQAPAKPTVPSTGGQS